MGHWDILTKNLIYIMYTISFDFPGGSDLKSLPTMWETWIRSLGQEGGRGNPLQYSCLENSTDRGAWRAIDEGHEESDTTEVLARTRARMHVTTTVWSPCS